MWRAQIRVSGMMGLVLAVALALAAVRSPTSVLASVEFTWMLLMLIAGVLGAIYRRGRQRAFWVGFELFGCVYAVLAFGPWFALDVQPHLVTTRAMAELFPVMHPLPPSPLPTTPVQDMDLYSYAYRSYDYQLLWERKRANFVRIGHIVTAQILALAGGIVALRFRDSMDGGNEPSAPVKPDPEPAR